MSRDALSSVCPHCGYTARDKALHGDHALCEAQHPPAVTPGEFDAVRRVPSAADRARPANRGHLARLVGLLEVATDPTQRDSIPPSWWASFGRECAEELPALLAALEASTARDHADVHDPPEMREPSRACPVCGRCFATEDHAPDCDLKKGAPF